MGVVDVQMVGLASVELGVSLVQFGSSVDYVDVRWQVRFEFSGDMHLEVDDWDCSGLRQIQACLG